MSFLETVQRVRDHLERAGRVSLKARRHFHSRPEEALPLHPDLSEEGAQSELPIVSARESPGCGFLLTL